MRELDRVAVLAYRLRVNGLGSPRLGSADLAGAAHCGLQDGSPRSALLSLAARVDNVGPDDWRSPALAQVFGPRGAVYVVPRTDIAVFTRGLLPRDPGRLERLETAAQRIHSILRGRSMRQADVVNALPEVGGTRGLRWAATLGTLVASWDTVDTIVYPAPTPRLDPEEARHELARRFFRYLGPATTADLQWWLDGLKTDATQTVQAIRTDLVPVTVEGEERFVTSATAHLLSGPAPDPEAVLLLPPDDTYINRRFRKTLVPDPIRQNLLWPKAPPPGALVVGGEVAGTWRRRGPSASVTVWDVLADHQRAAAERIAHHWPRQDGNSATSVTWSRLDG